MKKLYFISFFAILCSILTVSAQELKPENLGSNVNSKYAETAPIVSPDGKTVYFVVQNHPENNKGTSGSQDIWYAEKMYDGTWGKAERAPKIVNNQDYNGLLAVLSDGRLLIRGAFNNGVLEGLGYSFVTKNENNWGKPQKIIIKEYDDIMRGDLEDAAITADGKVLILSYLAKETGKTRDLFVCLLQKDGTYSAPLNMGETINTGKNEFAPFIASDGITIYFASDRKGGLGNSDIYTSKRLDDTWTKWSTPVNLGAPINTAGFDAYFTISASGDYAYMATNENSIGASDVVKIKLKEEIKPNAVTLVIGRVYNLKTKEPVVADIEVLTIPDNKPVGSSIKTSETGSFNLILTTGAKYSVFVKANGFITEVENIDLTEQKAYTEYVRNIALLPEDPSKHSKNTNIYTMVTNISKDSVGKDINRINIESRLKQLQGTSKKPVLVFLTDKEGKVIQTAIVGSDGFFRFTNLPADMDYQIAFDIPIDESNIEFDLVKVFNSDNNKEVYSAKMLRNKTIEIPLAIFKNGNIHTRILDPTTQKPLEGVTVYIIDDKGKIIATTKTDANGAFKFEKLPADLKYSLSFEQPIDDLALNLALDENYVPIPSKMAKKIVNVPAYMIKKKFPEGKIVYSQPKNSALVKLSLLDNNGKILDIADVNLDGIFVFKKLPATGYKISIEAPDDDAFASLKLDENYDPIAYKANKNSMSVNSDLVKNGTLESKVKDFRTNLPAAGVDIYLLDANGNIVAKTKTDKEGVFRFNKLPGSNYKIAFDGVDDDAFASLKVDENYVPQSVIDAESAKIGSLNKKQTDSELAKINQKSDKKIARYRFENIYFDFNKDELRPEAKNVLNDLVIHIKQNPTIVVELNGHTDDTGDEDYNKKLAARRTKSAVNYLVNKGISKKQLKEIHLGEGIPVSDNSTEEGKQLNRRIEFYVDEASDYTPEHTIYIAKPNDTLADIAKKYSMSVDELKQKNSLSSDNITPYSPIRVKKSL